MHRFRPCDFKNEPMMSVLKSDLAEVVARNIMVILCRTGNVFRELTFEEYKTERLKGGHFTIKEEQLIK